MRGTYRYFWRLFLSSNPPGWSFGNERACVYEYRVNSRGVPGEITIRYGHVEQKGVNDGG
jgi:hypothetical protein